MIRLSYGGFMKKHIILVCVILFSIGLLSTVFSSCGQRNSARGNDDGRQDDGSYRYDDGGDGSRGRGGIGSDCERSTREGGGSCDSDDDCEDQCDDLFGGRDYQECLDLSVNEVQGMWNAFDEDEGTLEDPDEDDLEDIHPDDIRNALDIDDRIWDSFIDDYGTSEANDVLYWVATNECIYEAIEDSFDEDDVESFMEDIFLQADSAGLIAAALEPLGDEADDDETFLYLADQEGNDKAVELMHDLLWEECLSSNSVTTAQRDMYDDVEESDDQNSACLLGEFYCERVDNKYILEDVFEDLVDNELDNYIRGGDNNSDYTDGLEIASSDYNDLEEVCMVVCDTAANGGIRKGQAEPSACD